MTVGAGKKSAAPVLVSGMPSLARRVSYDASISVESKRVGAGVGGPKQRETRHQRRALAHAVTTSAHQHRYTMLTAQHTRTSKDAPQ